MQYSVSFANRRFSVNVYNNHIYIRKRQQDLLFKSNIWHFSLCLLSLLSFYKE